MANVVKIIKSATKGKKTFTKGKDKAVMRASQTYDSNTKGLGLTKGSNKKTAKAAKKVGSFDTKIQKHPLIRNAGEPAAEGKYRGNRGKSVPVKKKGK
jgi:hypothetical protein